VTTPEEKHELDMLRRHTDRPGLASRLRGLAQRARTALGVLLETPAIPEVEITVRHDDEEDEDASLMHAPSRVAETPMEQATRIRKEYLEGVERFERQRQEWRGMWEESWPKHLTAERMLERILEDGRQQLVLLAKIASRELNAPVQISHAQRPGSGLGAVDAFERTMKQLQADVADIDVAAERARILEAEGEACRSPLVETRAVNHKLFALISIIEEERNVWNERSRAEQATHNGIQSKLQTAIEGAAESHGRLLAAVNDKRAARKAEPLRTREDLERAALEASSVGT